MGFVRSVFGGKCHYRKQEKMMKRTWASQVWIFLQTNQSEHSAVHMRSSAESRRVINRTIEFPVNMFTIRDAILGVCTVHGRGLGHVRDEWRNNKLRSYRIIFIFCHRCAVHSSPVELRYSSNEICLVTFAWEAAETRISMNRTQYLHIRRKRHRNETQNNIVSCLWLDNFSLWNSNSPLSCIDYYWSAEIKQKIS